MVDNRDLKLHLSLLACVDTVNTGFFFTWVQFFSVFKVTVCHTYLYHLIVESSISVIPKSFSNTTQRYHTCEQMLIPVTNRIYAVHMALCMTLHARLTIFYFLSYFKTSETLLLIACSVTMMLSGCGQVWGSAHVRNSFCNIGDHWLVFSVKIWSVSDGNLMHMLGHGDHTSSSTSSGLMSNYFFSPIAGPEQWVHGSVQQFRIVSLILFLKCIKKLPFYVTVTLRPLCWISCGHIVLSVYYHMPIYSLFLWFSLS